MFVRYSKRIPWLALAIAFTAACEGADRPTSVAALPSIVNPGPSTTNRLLFTPDIF